MAGKFFESEESVWNFWRGTRFIEASDLPVSPHAMEKSEMSRTSCLLLAVAFGLFVPTGVCRAQVGFGSRQGFINSGGNLNVSPIVTNNRRYVRMGVSASFSQLVEVQTFTAVQFAPGYVPMVPLALGYSPGAYPGFNQGLNMGPRRNFSIGPRNPNPGPTAIGFASRSWRFDKDKDQRLNRDELANLVSAAVTELKQTPAVYRKLKEGARGNKAVGTPVTERDVTDAFLKKCLTFDKNQDGALNAHETDLMATALMRFLTSR